MSEAPPVHELTVPQLVGVLENDERACAWAGTIVVPAAIAELRRRAADPTSLGQEEAERALSRLDLGAAPVEGGQGLQARVLLLLEQAIGQAEGGPTPGPPPWGAAAEIEAYARAAVHLAGLEAIHAGQQVGGSGKVEAYGKADVAKAIWEEIQERGGEIQVADSFTAGVVQKLEGGGV